MGCKRLESYVNLVAHSDAILLLRELCIIAKDTKLPEVKEVVCHGD